jgi:hypothetical protein
LWDFCLAQRNIKFHNLWMIRVYIQSRLSTEFGEVAKFGNYECRLEIYKIKKNLSEVTTKEIYTILLTKISKRPTSEQKWTESELLDNNDEDWTNIYHSKFNLTTYTKVQTFQFKITNRILACETKLYAWKIEGNSLCNFCNKEKDTIEHHLVMCKDNTNQFSGRNLRFNVWTTKWWERQNHKPI